MPYDFTIEEEKIKNYGVVRPHGRVRFYDNDVPLSKRIDPIMTKVSGEVFIEGVWYYVERIMIE